MLDQPLNEALATGSHVRVLRALFGMPEGLTGSGREIARRAGVSHPTATKVLRDLGSLGLVRIERRAGSEAFRLNRRNVLVEPIAGLFSAEESVPVRLLGWLTGRLETLRDVEAAYLFGSAARGEMTRESDIDLAVVVSAAAAADIEERLDPMIDELRERVGAPVQLVVSSSSRRRRGAGEKRLWERILKEGIVVKSPAKARTSPRRPK